MTNSSERTGTFRRKITSADASNVVAILDMNTINGEYQQFEEDFILGFAGMLESLQVSVGLWSLRPAEFPQITPLMSEAQKQAELYRIMDSGQKMSISLHIAKGNGPWEYVSECVLQNRANNEWYVPLLVPFLTVNEVLLIDRDFRLGVRIESKWQGPLKSGDYLVISGSWRQRVTFSSKKNEDEVLAARIEALELALYGRLTGLPANSFIGSIDGGIAENLSAADSRSNLGLGNASLLSFSLPLSVANGGTGAQDAATARANLGLDSIVDLESNQTIDGIKNFTDLRLGANKPFQFNDSHTFGANFNSLKSGVFSGDTASVDVSLAGWHVFTSTNARGNGYGVQLALSDTETGRISHRNKSAGIWQPWKKIWNESYGIPVWQAPSDSRLKNSVKPIENALELILKSNPVRFRYTAKIRSQGLFGSLQERYKPHYGFLAQDFPIDELVTEKDNGEKGINYLEIIPFLVGAIQELQEQIDVLKKKGIKDERSHSVAAPQTHQYTVQVTTATDDPSAGATDKL